MTKPVAIITGASSGIGLEFARRLAATHDLVLVARRLDRLQEVKAELEAAHGNSVEAVAADLTVDSEVEALATRIAAQPRLALMINNAGFGAVVGPFWKSQPETNDSMFKLHVLATMRLSQAALANMVAAGDGALINVGSVASFLLRHGTVGYSTTKAWIANFTTALNVDLKHAGSRVQVQALCPGYTYTEFHDVFGVDRKRIAGAKLWLSVDEVVDASLRGLARNKLIVIPGWRYKLLVNTLGRLPQGLAQWIMRSRRKR